MKNTVFITHFIISYLSICQKFTSLDDDISLNPMDDSVISNKIL